MKIMLQMIRPSSSLFTYEIDKLFSPSNYGKDYSSLSIPIEVFDKETSWLVKAYLPGINKEDVNLDVENGKLFLSAVRHKPEDKIYLSELEYGKMETSVKLTSVSYLDKENISAKYLDGVLYITIHKPNPSLPYKVQIG